MRSLPAFIVDAFRPVRLLLSPLDWLRRAIAFACITLLVLTCVAIAPVFADDGGASAAGVSVATAIIISIATAIPGLIGTAWAWFKAHSAQTEASWDDWTVNAVENTCREMLQRSGWKLTPPDGSSSTSSASNPS